MSENITTTPEPKAVELAVVADRSGSMISILNDAIGAFNAFIDQQQQVEGEAKLTVALFDTQYEIMQEGVDIKAATKFDKSNFVPRGSTALFDAIGRTLTKLIARRESGEIDAVIVTILTDGEENASREFRAEDIKKLIEKCEKEYGWEFIFLAANQDAFATGSTFGIKAANAYNFAADAAGLVGATKSMNLRSTEYRTMYAQSGLDKLAQKDSDSEESN
jgi:Mg-chelatase subunit ChlD